MSLKINVLASRVAAVGITAGQAVQIIEEVVSLIGVVEQVYDGLKGDVKFKAVMSALDEMVAQMGLSDKLEAIRAKVAPMVNLLVTILNAGNLWASVFGSISAFAQQVAASMAPKPAAPPLQASVGAQLIKPDPANTAQSQG